MCELCSFLFMCFARFRGKIAHDLTANAKQSIKCGSFDAALRGTKRFTDRKFDGADPENLSFGWNSSSKVKNGIRTRGMLFFVHLYTVV